MGGGNIYVRSGSWQGPWASGSAERAALRDWSESLPKNLVTGAAQDVILLYRPVLQVHPHMCTCARVLDVMEAS